MPSQKAINYLVYHSEKDLELLRFNILGSYAQDLLRLSSWTPEQPGTQLTSIFPFLGLQCSYMYQCYSRQCSRTSSSSMDKCKTHGEINVATQRVPLSLHVAIAATDCTTVTN